MLATELAGAQEKLAELARELDMAGIDCVVGIGGDGTLNEIVNGLMTRKDGAVPPLGMIAGG